MKNKFLKFLSYVTACIIGVALCAALYYFVDEIMNGSLLDWFDKNYIITRESYDPASGRYILIQQPDYERLKPLVFRVLTGSIIFWLSLLFFVSSLCARARVKKSVTRIGGMIYGLMHTKEGGMELFPKEYAEISAQMAEIKSTMQLHEQKLKEEATRKNDLIVYLAHDLKTPLTSVIGYLSLLKEAPDMPADQRAKYVGITFDKACRLEELINEFFEITRYNLQEIKLEKEKIDLCYLLVQLTDEFYPLLHAHGNTVELCVDEDTMVYGDADKLARVFNNILKNAVAYSYPDTAIQIWVEQGGRKDGKTEDENEQGKIGSRKTGQGKMEQRKTGQEKIEQEKIEQGKMEQGKTGQEKMEQGKTGQIKKEWTDMETRIFFRNQGRNIPQKRLESIFEKFFRMDEARTSNTGGAGLGLAIAKEIVTLHGGCIAAESLGETITFCVTLPAEDANLLTDIVV